jgi:hypothetical protein
MKLLYEKGVLQCICLEMHRYVQAPFWSAGVAESTPNVTAPLYPNGVKYLSFGFDVRDHNHKMYSIEQQS